MDDYDYETDTGYRYGTPAASPTFRPGMYPNDIRDPNSLNEPVSPHGPP